MRIKIRKKLLLVIALLLIVGFSVVAGIFAFNPDLQEYETIGMKQRETVSGNIISSSITTRFAEALDRTEQRTPLDTGGPYTVFVPLDDAFTNLPEETAEAIFGLDDYSSIVFDVVPYHIVPGIYMFADLKDGMRLKTLQGEELTFQKQGDSLLIDGYSYTKVHDIVSKNGVIHLIDNYLIPPSLSK